MKENIHYVRMSDINARHDADKTFKAPISIFHSFLIAHYSRIAGPDDVTDRSRLLTLHVKTM